MTKSSSVLLEQDHGSTVTPPARRLEREHVSVAGVMVLSAVSVGLSILAMILVAVVLVGLWWLISHIPVPPGVSRILSHLHF